jgi:hypothetical protein
MLTDRKRVKREQVIVGFQQTGHRARRPFPPRPHEAIPRLARGLARLGLDDGLKALAHRGLHMTRRGTHDVALCMPRHSVGARSLATRG